MSAGGRLERVYVWQMPVRIAHWTMMLSILALAATGLYISRPFVSAPGEASAHFVMGWMRTIHFLAAIAFTLAVVSRLVWMFLGSPYAKWDQLVPTTKQRLRDLWKVIRFYAFPRGDYPFKGAGHNPLAGLSYVAYFSLALLVIASGFALYSMEAGIGSPMRWFDFLVPLLGGAARARWIHHVLMWPILLFALVHVYIVLFVARVEGGGVIDSMFTGWKDKPR